MEVVRVVFSGVSFVIGDVEDLRVLLPELYEKLRHI
jgi:hypothetical protein